MDTYDVVVLGPGAARLRAAIAAHAGGASVAVFEKGDQVGGTTADPAEWCLRRRRQVMASVMA